MKLLVVGNLYPPFIFGGYEILCRQVVEELRLRGHEIRVLTSRYGLDLGPPPEETGVTRTLELTTSFPRPGEDVGFVDFRLSSIQRVAVINAQLTRDCLDAWPPDLVFCWCLNRLSLGPIFSARERGIPFCYTVNDEHPRQFRCVSSIRSPRTLLRFIAEKWLWPMATLRNLPRFPVTVLSEATKRRLIAQETPIEHAEVIHQGIPIAKMPFQFNPHARAEQFRMLYIGQISKAKGIHTILRAAAILKRVHPEHDLRITIVGTGVPEYQRELDALVRAGDLSDRVDMPGKVTHDRIVGYHRTHHGLIFSSEWEEPFGLAHLEAMAFGTPVISTTTGGSAELIRDGDNALAYRAGDPEHLAERVYQLMSDEEGRKAMAIRARAHVEKHHDFLGYVDRLEDFLARTRQQGA